MLNINPLLLVGGVIGAVTALLFFAYASAKDKKTAMGFERTMADGEILRRLFAYAKPTLSPSPTSSSTRSRLASLLPALPTIPTPFP